MNPSDNTASSAASQYALNVPAEILTSLSNGALDSTSQRLLLQQLTSENNRIAALGRSTAPSPLLSHLMDVDSGLGSLGTTLTSASGRGRRLQVLPCTRNMKTLAKNTVEKLARLRLRLVKLGEASSLEKQKPFFQFRLVQVEDIGKDNKKELDGRVGTAVSEVLVKDVQDLITALENEQKKLGERLLAELTEASEAAHAKASNNHAEEVKKLWEDLITYNVRWFAEELVKFEAGITTKTSKKPKSKSQGPNDRIKLSTLKRPAPSAGAKNANKRNKKEKPKKGQPGKSLDVNLIQSLTRAANQLLKKDTRPGKGRRQNNNKQQKNTGQRQGRNPQKKSKRRGKGTGKKQQRK